MIEIFVSALIAALISFGFGHMVGWKRGRKALLNKHVEYPGLPDNFDPPPATYDDFARPKIFGKYFPEL